VQINVVGSIMTLIDVGIVGFTAFVSRRSR